MEFALILTLLSVPLVNIVDLGVYVYDRMQVDMAAQAGAEAAWITCNSAAKLPATSNCSSMSTNVQTAVQSTTLGTNVTYSIAENYYCVTSTNQLTQVAAYNQTPPSNCSGVTGGSVNDRPGDWVLVSTSYSYSPIFAAVSVVSFLGTPITRQSWMKLK